jgi:hypothetical protein
LPWIIIGRNNNNNNSAICRYGLHNDTWGVLLR